MIPGELSLIFPEKYQVLMCCLAKRMIMRNSRCVDDTPIVCSDIVILSRQAGPPVHTEMEVDRVLNKERSHLLGLCKSPATALKEVWRCQTGTQNEARVERPYAGGELKSLSWS